uniref:Uncharacterized protein n=1 Tax=Solanum tuberosum TaxID=4113 RepID=M1D9B3_SOLTU
MASSSQAATEADDEGGKDDAWEYTLPTRSQPPLLGAQVEEDLAAVRKRLRGSFASTTPVPPSTALEVEMLRRELCQERRKDLQRDHLMVRMWKTLKIIFSYVAPRSEVPLVETRDFKKFTFMDEAVTGLVPPKDLDYDDDTSQFQ